MDRRRFLHFLVIILQWSSFLSSGFNVNGKVEIIAQRRLLLFSTTQKDITTPIPTVPTTNPTTPTITMPVINPTVSDPDSPSAAATTTTTPFVPPATATSPPSSSASWCVASQSASPAALQVALDYACGHGGSDCSPIQLGGRCYNPNTLRNHASFAFNSYYQRNPVPASCNFGGTGVITSTDPSREPCQYPPTSTTTSVLNITSSRGATVFGGGPSNPTGSLSVKAMPNPGSFIAISLLIALVAADNYM